MMYPGRSRRVTLLLNTRPVDKLPGSRVCQSSVFDHDDSVDDDSIETLTVLVRIIVSCGVLDDRRIKYQKVRGESFANQAVVRNTNYLRGQRCHSSYRIRESQCSVRRIP